MKGEARHESSWRLCRICSQEFLAQRATVCRECQHNMYEKAKNEEYEKLVDKGGVTEL
jgi:uncharacterized Zn ribbon protein